jgi:hypothetical protein
MATVVLQPDVVTDAGKAPAYTTPLVVANTYVFRNNGRTLLYFRKTGANPCTVSIVSPKTLKGHAVVAQTFVVPANVGDVVAGPFDHDVYDDVNHDVTFSVSEITGLSVAVIQVPTP